MNFKKFNGTTWETVQHKIYGSGTEQLASFPAQIQAAGEPLTDYTIYGNTLQNGTPTPEAPVEVLGCGVRTWNLLDESTESDVDATHVNYNKSVPIFLTAGQTYTFSCDAVCNGLYIRSSADDSSLASANNSATLTYTPQVNVGVYCRVWDSNGITNLKPMFNLGSTALPYEPYGYKLPLTVNGTEYPIYLGQVETTRRIKKLVLTGEETVTQSVVTNCVQIDAPDSVKIPTVYSSHFQSVDIVPTEVMRNGKVFHAGGAGMRSVCFGTNSNPLTFKQWLSDQFAAGTPVTLWYVLAEPETGITNEPLMKIGNYADTISFAQAGVTIPTSDGDNTITFGTTVQPSGMSATFRGWHPVPTPKTYDGNDWS